MAGKFLFLAKTALSCCGYRANGIYERSIMPAGEEHHLDTVFDKGLKVAFPPVLVRLLQALLEPSPSFQAISSYLQMDPMLAAKVLQLVNSSSYSFNTRISNLERAVIAIGTKELFKLVLPLSLQKQLIPNGKRNPEDVFDDWSLTIWAAIASEAIALRLCPAQSQEAYLAGMLKDLPLFLELCREDIPPFLSRIRLATVTTPGQLSEELAHWGYSHPELARDIFLYWDLPFELAEAVRLHHDYEGRLSHSRLTQSVIYGTRWAELAHAPDSDPGDLVVFELSLATELNLSLNEMEEFRAMCTKKYTEMLSYLGISPKQRDQQLHTQSLAAIQQAYFLALGALNDSAPFTPDSFARSMRHYLRLFWDVKTFILYLNFPESDHSSLFRCDPGSPLTEMHLTRGSAPSKPDWFTIPLSDSDSNLGYLALPQEPELSADDISLPTFVRIFGMRFDDYRRYGSPEVRIKETDRFSFALARLDQEGNIKQLSHRFLKMLNATNQTLAPDLGIQELLEKHFGECPFSGQTLRDAALKNTSAKGWVMNAGTNGTPKPIYVGLSPDSDVQGESNLLLGDITHLPSLASLFLAHSTLPEALLRVLNLQLRLIDASGAVVWAESTHSPAVGENIFTLFQSPDPAKISWTPSVLGTLTGKTKLMAALTADSGKKRYNLLISPLQDSDPPLYFMLVNLGSEREKTE